LWKEGWKLQALIIIGHGSHLNADSSAPVYRHAEAIRRTGVFDEVRECFWKEEPSMREVFDLVESEDVYVVPLFISEGYFTEEVIPRELGLSGPAPSVTEKPGKTVRYTLPVGTHPSMSAMILRRAEESAGLTDAQAREAGLVIIGHGTERNSNSSEVIYRVTREAEAAGVFARVRTGFLDQAPEVGEVLEEMEEPSVVLVPFFVAEGWHTQETIPDDLGINRPAVSHVTEKDGRTIFYAAPVGTFPEIAEIVLQRAREAGARIPAEVRVTEAASV
jgi:sirohydrochlorin cobaltochelatase